MLASTDVVDGEGGDAVAGARELGRHDGGGAKKGSGHRASSGDLTNLKEDNRWPTPSSSMDFLGMLRNRLEEAPPDAFREIVSSTIQLLMSAK